MYELIPGARDAFAKRLHSVRETALLLYNRLKQNIEYEREKLKEELKFIAVRCSFP